MCELASGTTTYEYDESNQLTGEARPTGEIVTYSYDENGNLVLESSSVGGITTYSYDARNRLANVTKPSGDEVEFVYDGNDNRYEKRSIPASGSPTSTFYAYDGDGNIFLEYNAAQTWKVRYIRDPNGKALAMDNNGTMYWFVHNEHGDVVKAIDSSGTVAASYAYDEFGNLKSSTGALYNPIRYSGANNAYFDSETGLYKMGARYYKPEAGRWITRDRYLGANEDLQSRNQYAYSRGNPINRADPGGFWDMDAHARWTRDAGRAIISEWAGRKLAWGSKIPDLYTPAIPLLPPLDKYGFLSRHFDCRGGAYLSGDSRWRHYRRLRGLAEDDFERNKYGHGYEQLGCALHMFPQDYFAHGYIFYTHHLLWPCDSPSWPGESRYNTPGFYFNRFNWRQYGWPAYGHRRQTAIQRTRYLIYSFISKFV